MIPRGRQQLAALVAVALAACGAPSAAAARRAPSELSNSFIITSLQDLQPSSIRGAALTPCEYAVARAKALGQRHFSLVVTAYWHGGMAGVQHYSFKDVSNGVSFPQPTVESVGQWRLGLQRCFKAATRAGFSGLQILNHIDSEAQSEWRNFLDFDPLAKYGGWSYEDIVVRPTAEALKAVIRPDTKVWYMLSGEMGRSIFEHPVSYLKLMSKYRGSLTEGRAPGSVKVGVALHWNKVCGNCFEMPQTDNFFLYNSTYHSTFWGQAQRISKDFDLPMIRRVFEVCDVIGISHYAPLPGAGLAPSMFGMPIDTAAYELAHWGVDLKKLTAPGARDFLFSEVGLGGGDASNQRAAASVAEVASNPLNGIWTVYNVKQDPWSKSDYKSYRREWFKALLQFLHAGGGPAYKVDAAFIWSVGTWDVAAIHPISTSTEGTYADWEVVKWMRWLSTRVAQ